jgi:hypothetical protein
MSIKLLMIGTGCKNSLANTGTNWVISDSAQLKKFLKI